MTDSRLSNLSVVLFEPQNPVNIAGTVRAMKNMGLESLRLVRPCNYDPVRLEGIAHDTWDIINGIQHFDDFDAAVGDCVRLVGYTARRRAAKWRILNPKEAAEDALQYVGAGRVGIVFGREDHGLPNDVLDRLHAVVTIPTTEHASLNLAQAVLIALYELHLASGDATRVLPRTAQGCADAHHRPLRALFRRAPQRARLRSILQDALSRAHHALTARDHLPRRPR